MNPPICKCCWSFALDESGQCPQCNRKLGKYCKSCKRQTKCACGREFKHTCPKELIK